MAIYGINEEITSNTTIKDNESLAPHYESDTVDTGLLATISGQRWKVTFFHRVAPNNLDINPYDPNVDITLHDYIRVDDFIIRLDSPIPVGTPDGMEGSGIIDSPFHPNPIDVFLAKAPDGRTVIYVLTAVKRINYNDNYVYKIEFKAYTVISDPNDPTLTKLLQATTEHFVYNEDFRLTRNKPIYKKEEYEIREDYLLYIETLLKIWNNNFIKANNKYFISYRYKLPNSDDAFVRVFDPFMEKFIKHTVGLANLAEDMELVSIEDDSVTILDTFLRNDVIYDNIKKYVLIKGLGGFNNNPYLFPIHHTGIEKIISVTDIDDTTIVSNNETINDIFPKIDNKFYIFRKYIYLVLGGANIEQFSDNLTLFETMVLKMLTGNILNRDDIVTIYKNIVKLDEPEMFYFIPIFIYMLRYTLEVFTIDFTD